MKYQQHKDKKCTCVFFTIADLSIYLYLTYCKPWQSINMNVVPPLPWEMSSMNSKFMIVCIYTWKPIYMCRRWILRWNLRLPIQILRHPMPHDFCKLQSFLKSSKSVQELLSSSRETFSTEIWKMILYHGFVKMASYLGIYASPAEKVQVLKGV